MFSGGKARSFVSNVVTAFTPLGLLLNREQYGGVGFGFGHVSFPESLSYHCFHRAREQPADPVFYSLLLITVVPDITPFFLFALFYCFVYNLLIFSFHSDNKKKEVGHWVAWELRLAVLLQKGWPVISL